MYLYMYLLFEFVNNHCFVIYSVKYQVTVYIVRDSVKTSYEVMWCTTRTCTNFKHFSKVSKCGRVQLVQGAYGSSICR